MGQQRQRRDRLDRLLGDPTWLNLVRSFLEGGQWGEPTQPDNMGGDHDMSQMEGMLSDEELQQLSDAPVLEAAELFLNQMIAHHEGAVAMAEDQVENGTYPPAVDLAQTVIDTQQQEIDTMRQLLDPM